jgi:hypothetical protein
LAVEGPSGLRAKRAVLGVEERMGGRDVVVGMVFVSTSGAFDAEILSRVLVVAGSVLVVVSFTIEWSCRRRSPQRP